MKTANCPSCGALVAFRSPASLLAVCEYCRSTLVRHGAEVENLGRMAELLEDASLIRLGTEGKFHGMHFAVIGRIQLQYAQGLWNEWHLLFDNQRSGWLGEANGDYTITFLTPPKEPLLAFGELTAGMTLELIGEPFTVTDIEQGKCIAGEGELLFKVGAGYDAPSADLRSAKNYATIDYSESPPLLFMGESVSFDDLHFANLRDPSEAGNKTVAAGVLRCSSCGSSIELHAPGIKSVACGNCHAVLDAEDPELKILSSFSDAQRTDPFIPLGTEGKIDNIPYRVLGYLRRSGNSDGIEFKWDEYLLYNPTKNFRWLTQYNGHWNFASPIQKAPVNGFDNQGKATLAFNGRVYRHFETSAAKVNYVAGEFYWRVGADESVTVSDYIAPPCVISEEKNDNEITWTLGEYIEPEAVKKAFSITRAMPSQNGIAPNQPWPSEVSYRQLWKSFWIVSLLVILIQAVTVMRSDNHTVFSTPLNFPAGNSEPVTTAEFEIKGHTGNIHLINHVNVDNSWADIRMELIERDSGKMYAVNRAISFYYGSDSDGAWSEGSTSDDAIIAAVPPGHYLLSVESESDKPVSTQLEVKRNVPSWLNFFIVELLLLLFPLLYLWRRYSFEVKRWSDSDHPMLVSSSDSDDSSDD